MSLKEVKLRLPADDLQRLDKEAQFKGVARAELLRQLVLRNTANKGEHMSLNDFHKLVEKARRRVGGGLDKRKVEGIVAFVFSELAS